MTGIWTAYSIRPPYVPVAVAGTVEELSEMIGVDVTTILTGCATWRHGRRCACRYRVTRFDGGDGGHGGWRRLQV